MCISKNVQLLINEEDRVKQYVRGKNLQGTAMKLNLSASVSHVWAERNSWIFKLEALEVPSILPKNEVI